MVYEIWNVKFDIERLQNHLKEFVFPLEVTYQSAAFGGWSVLSSNSSHKDGWFKGHKQYDSNLSPQAIEELLKKSNAKKPSEYILPTEICHGYLQEVIETIASYNLSPYRARIAQLATGMSSVWHTDGAEDQYSVRLHVPIQTNPHCFFETETEREHLTADGSAYFLYVNRLHRVVNDGPTHRYHLIMDVRDTTGVTQHHRYEDFLKKRNRSC